MISLQSSLPVITPTDVRFDGTDRSPVVDGGGQYAILRAGPSASLVVERMNFQFGLNDDGGCIGTEQNNGSGSLTVNFGYFFQCKASAPGLSGGGAIAWAADDATLVSINDSAFFENRVETTDVGSEQPRGGAVYASVTTIIRRSIFQDNFTAPSDGR